MDNDIQLISDGDGLAVIGEPSAVEKFLRSAGQWAVSKKLDLDRLKPLLGLASDVVRAGSEIAANSGRWIKLTEESARLVKQHGLMETKTPGVSHLMVGIPGKVQNWLQSDQVPCHWRLNGPIKLAGHKMRQTKGTRLVPTSSSGQRIRRRRPLARVRVWRSTPWPSSAASA